MVYSQIYKSYLKEWNINSEFLDPVTEKEVDKEVTQLFK